MSITRSKIGIMALLLIAMMFSTVIASHYRGGSLRWAVSPADPSKLIVSWRVSWRRSYEPASGFKCERPGQELNGEGCLLCKTCVNETVIYAEPLKFNCTDFSDEGEATDEDWTTGIGSYEYAYERNKFNLTFQFLSRTHMGSNWIRLENYGQANYYKMVSSVDLDVRNGTNSSPATTMLPIIRVQAGCTSKIRIPTLDADKDVVRCRWAVKNSNECPEKADVSHTQVCGPITSDSLIDENRCEITFSSAGKSPGWYGVSVMIEDFANKTSTIPLSMIPLQFLIYVYPLELPCRQIQVSSPLCEVIQTNELYTARIEAFSETAGVRIVSIDTVTPLGMRRSNLMQSSEDPSKFFIELNWTPSETGEETVCYYASDNNGVSSEQSCFKVVVMDSPQSIVSRPEPSPLSSHPIPGQSVSPTLSEWHIYYSTNVQRPLYSKKIYIKSLTGDVLAEVDSSEEDEVEFVKDGNATRLRFATPGIVMPDKQSLLIELEEGAVVAGSFGPCAQDLGSTGAGWLFKTDSSLDAPTEPTVVCDPDEMSIFIPRVYVGSTPARKFMLHDPNCRGNSFNETHFVVRTRFEECGSVIKKKNGKLTVRNTVRDKIRPLSSGLSVSRRKHKFEIRAMCKSEVTYNNDITLNPDSVETSFAVQGVFDVAASMALYTDGTYNDQYPQTDVSLNQRLFVSIVANEENVFIKVEKCKAYALDGQVNVSDGEYVFLDNGCPVEQTMRFEESPASNEKRFSLDAFTFLYKGIHDSMRVTCIVSFCGLDEEDNCRQCTDTAITGNTEERGRRSIPGDGFRGHRSIPGDDVRGRRGSQRLAKVYLNI
ncbi:uncharacterized protein [Antedon mediterranea]|uniref:uncharacterized protein n=1 Tax=Antedon mediterranea TaxID=105859 RepID=UPI003AF83CB1